MKFKFDGYDISVESLGDLKGVLLTFTGEAGKRTELDRRWVELLIAQYKTLKAMIYGYEPDEYFTVEGTLTATYDEDEEVYTITVADIPEPVFLAGINYMNEWLIDHRHEPLRLPRFHANVDEPIVAMFARSEVDPNE